MQIRPAGAKMFHADGHMTNLQSLSVTFRTQHTYKFPQPLKKYSHDRRNSFQWYTDIFS